MEEKNKDYWDEIEKAATENRSEKEVKKFASHSVKGKEKDSEDNGDKPSGSHPSQGHKTDAKGTATTTGEPTLRSATRDSSRMPKSDNDEGPTGGNIR